MDVTSLPTESLHKFLALSGLLILTVGPAYLHRLHYQIIQKLIEAETEDDILTRQIDHFEKIGKLFESEQSLHKVLLEQKLRASTQHFDDKVTEASAIYKENSKSYLELTDKALVIKISIAKQRGNVKYIRLLHDQMREVMRWGYGICALGMLMACIGFYRWYGIQEYIDQGIIKEAAKK